MHVPTPLLTTRGTFGLVVGMQTDFPVLLSSTTLRFARTRLSQKAEFIPPPPPLMMASCLSLVGIKVGSQGTTLQTPVLCTTREARNGRQIGLFSTLAVLRTRLSTPPTRKPT